MRTLRCVILTSVLAVGAAPACLCAQSTPAATDYSQSRSFRLPIQFDARQRQDLQELHLYVTEDRGQTWRPAGTVAAQAEYFAVTVQHDGDYWFSVRIVDRSGRSFPATTAGLSPQRHVCVDSTPPLVQIRGYNPSGAEVGIEWNIEDAHVDLNSLRVEFRPADSKDWYPVEISPQPAGRQSWRAGMNGPLEIRLRILDLAKNEGVASVTLNASQGISPLTATGTNGYRADAPIRPDEMATQWAPPPPPSGLPDPAQATPAPKSFAQPDLTQGTTEAVGMQRMLYPKNVTNQRFVNSKQFGINYSFEDVGKSGIGSVVLYYTVDGENWKNWGEDQDRESPFMVNVTSEGIYGFSLVARSVAGLGDDPPRTGDPAQIWVEVDLTPPEVALHPPVAGHGSSAGILTITWEAADRNLAPSTVRLAYSQFADGPWTKIEENINNTGRYQWQMPEGVPYKFYVRLEVEDKAGNIGRKQTDREVIVDLMRPRAKVIGVEPRRDVLPLKTQQP